MMSNHYRNSACSVRHVMLGVDDDGHRPVIDQSDPHMRAETTFLHRHSPGAQRLVELDPHEIGMLGLAGLDEARAIALVHVGEQRELRDGENLAADVLRFRILWANQAICLSPSSSVTPTRIMNPGPICCGSNVGSSVPNSLTTSTDASDTRCNTTFMVPYSTTCAVITTEPCQYCGSQQVEAPWTLCQG